MFILENSTKHSITILCLIIVLFNSCSLLKGYRINGGKSSVSTNILSNPESDYVAESIKVTELMDNSDPLLPRKKELLTFRIGNEVHGNKKILKLNSAGVDDTKFLSYKMLSFFPRSEYEIDSAMKKSAREVFKPMVDSLFHEQTLVPQTSFIAKIIVAGYSDAVAIKDGSPTYEKLKEKMKGSTLNSRSMNSYLSFLRANAVASIIRDLILERSAELKLYDKVYL